MVIIIDIFLLLAFLVFNMFDAMLNIIINIKRFTETKKASVLCSAARGKEPFSFRG